MVSKTLCCVLLLCFGYRAGHAARYAVIAGCNKGGENVAALKYAENDAREFADILQTLGGFELGNVRMVADCDSALLKRSLSSIDSLMKHDKDPNSLFLFYYSGHADAGHLLLNKQRYPLSALHDYFDSCAASIKIGIFDACYSGSVTTMKGGTQTQPFYFQEQKTIQGRIIIASSAASEAAQESQTLKGSIFSHHWFNALRGSADIANSRQVTINQAYQYAYRKTLETTALTSGEIQHPVYKFDIHGQGDIVLTSLTKASSSLVFDRTCEGKFLVLSDDYIDVFADFSKKSGAEALIALRPGAYRIINALGRDIGTHSFSLAKNETYRMNAGRLILAPPAFSRLKGPNADTANPSDKASTPLSTHSWRIGASGLLLFCNKEKQSFLPGLSFVNAWYADNAMDLFLDIRLNVPGAHAGLMFGFDYYFNDRQIPFYTGLAVGPHYLEKAGAQFRDRAGISFMGHSGYFTDFNRNMQIRIQIPYQLYIGTKFAYSIGLEMQCIFFGPYRDVKVLHL
jgi:hypothetical protein